MNPIFSIVVPVYFNEPNIPDTVPQLLALGERLPGYDIELVFVDDGSGDRSLELLTEHQRRHPANIKIVKLTRNFGSMAAIQAGLHVASGDCVGMISADLQDPPEMFVDMVHHWEKGTKAVLAVRVDRDEPALQKALSNTFYALMRRFAIRHYPPGGFDYFLLDRQAVDEVNRIWEKNTNIMTLIFWMGYPYVALPYVRRRRAKGKSRWTMAKKMKLFVDSLVGFSYVPIRLLSFAGLCVATGAFAYAGVVFWNRLVHGFPVQGWASMVILLGFTAGIQMLMLGILGEYVWRTLDETRRRPPFIVDEILDRTALTVSSAQLASAAAEPAAPPRAPNRLPVEKARSSRGE
jgi:polyisoprenyl-phosphate glycosyltransferase